MIKRRHKFILLTETISLGLVFLFILAVAITFLFISLSWPDWLIKFFPELSQVAMNYFLLFPASLLLLILWVCLFAVITDYYLDCWIVTGERTIHTELKGFFNRTVSTVSHEQIQDISVDIHGIFPMIFRYGDLHIQTAGKFREFIFRQIPNPYEVKDIIFKAQKKFLKERNSF